MKPDTEQIIQSLRAAAWENEKIMDLAADRLEELQKECDEARAEVEQLAAKVATLIGQVATLIGQRERAMTSAQWLRSCRPSAKRFKAAEAELDALEKEVQG